MITARTLGVAALALSAVAVSATAVAQCEGGLVFLGPTADQTRSVWLSATREAGDFQLAVPGQTVDAWTRSRRGLRLSVSPVVQNGTPGEHTLSNPTAGCSIASIKQNQGSVFPQLPNRLPPNLRPGGNSGGGAVGVMPTVPGGVAPPIATLPQGVTPPVATLPPSGITPTVPGGVAPPIATLPPGGVTPTVPGGVAPPIATLPQGVTPPIATLPPSGITPTVPGGVAPPIATLPPGGLTPTVPGGVAPPIATLPPGGVTPTVPGGVAPPIATLPPGGVAPPIATLPQGVTPPVATLPPSGVTPTVPGAVVPPVATLPPVGVTPTVPGGVAPPIATLPQGVTPPVATLPPSGITPTVPNTGAPPIVLPPGAATPQSTAAERSVLATPTIRCIDTAADPTETAGEVQRVDCTDPRQRALVEAQPANPSNVPITPGREFAPAYPWNTWVDARYDSSRDRRNNLDTESDGAYVTIGLDRLFRSNLVGGMNVSMERNTSTGFDGEWRLESSGFSVGPYMGMQLSPRWSLDASLSFGRIDNDNRVAVLAGSNTTERVSVSVNATTQHAWGETWVRPKLSLYSTHGRNDAYDLSGSIAGLSIALPVASNSFDSTAVGVSTEMHRNLLLSGGKTVVPYAEFGVLYDFKDTQILTGSLTYVDGSRWSGFARVGGRASFPRSTALDAAISYQSLGTSDLDVWELKVFVSHSF